MRMCACLQKSAGVSNSEGRNIEYLALDFVDSHGGDTGTVEKTPGDESTEYGEIDWVKTQALTSTRKEVETGRKFSEQSLDG